MDIARLVVEYLKVVLSPQTIAGSIVLAFLFLFKEDIKALILRIAKIRLPGGSELSISQLERAHEELIPKIEKPPVTPTEEVLLPENISLNPDQIEAVRQLFEAERAKATLWKYRYLNYFIAPITQRVLDWLASLSTRTTVTLFDSLWLPIVPNAEERRAIINALQAHYLIALAGELIEVTPKGRDYLQWRGPLPEAAT